MGYVLSTPSETHQNLGMMHVQKPVGYFVRAVLLMPLYIPLFAPKASSSATAGSVYTIVLKVRPSSQVQ